MQNDTARFEGEASDYQIIGGSTYAIIIGPDGSRDKVFDVEYLRFADGLVTLGAGSALDGAGELEDLITAETIALLYEAALDRDNDPRGIDTPGLNFWTDFAEELLTERGLGLREMSEVIAGFLMESPEFEEKFFNVDTVTNEAFLDRVYQNILGRAPDRSEAGELGGFEFYLGLLDGTNGPPVSKEVVFADIAISRENAEQSAEALMTLFQDSTPDRHQNTDIMLEWYFVA